jgi:hypothetical protein
MNKITLRNALIVFGCYWLSKWVWFPIELIMARITSGIIYGGQLGALLMYAVDTIPLAIVAFGAGTLCVNFIELTSYKKWLCLLALLYPVLHFKGIHWVRTPDTLDLILQGMESIIPSIACYVGGTIMANKLRKHT